jgi:hypothetical protein
MSESDQILAPAENLVSAGVKFSDKALQVLSIHSDLDSFSQTLHDSLPDGLSRFTLDKFWSAWSKLLLSMANEIESIAILLNNAAVAYLESDKAIMQAFHSDQAAQDTINNELNQIKDDKNKFDDKFNQEKQADENVDKQKEPDQKAADQEQKDINKKKAQDDFNKVPWTHPV